MLIVTNVLRAVQNGFAPEAERRLHNRARNLWRSFQHGHEIPRLADFDVTLAEDIFEHGFLLSVDRVDRPVVVQAGEILRQEAELVAIPISLCLISESSLLGQFGRRWREATNAREPISSEYEFTTDQHYKVSCRGVLLPLSQDGMAINHIYGVVSWKSQKV